MNWRGPVGMYAQVTAVAVLIWFWAAAETRGHDSASFRLSLVPASPMAEVVRPSDLVVNVQMEGSRLALQTALLSTGRAGVDSRRYPRYR